MRRIASALEVRPADLLAAATFAEFADEVQPYLPEASEALAKPLSARNLGYWRVVVAALGRAGIERGQIILVDRSIAAVRAKKTGDCVMVEIRPVERKGGSVRILRQFVAPALLTTNHSGTNTSFLLDGDNQFEPKIIGVVIS